MGYIYIAWDVTKANQAKIGMTTGAPNSRISQTENPDYVLFSAYEVENNKLKTTEEAIHKNVSSKYIRKTHRSTNRLSEWFNCTPKQAQLLVIDYLINENNNNIKINESKIADIEDKNTKLKLDKERVNNEKELYLEEMTDAELDFLLDNNHTTDYELDELLEEKSERDSNNYFF